MSGSTRLLKRTNALAAHLRLRCTGKWTERSRVPLTGLLSWNKRWSARHSGTIANVAEATVPRVLPNSRGKVRSPTGEADHYNDER
jgi:hypothetical protein